VAEISGQAIEREETMNEAATEEAVVEVLTREIAAVERESTALTIRDTVTEQAAMLMIAKCRDNEKRLEEERKAQTDPLRVRIDIITAPYKKAMEGFAAIRLEIDRRLQDYRRRKALEQQQEQQRLLAEKRKQEDEARLALQKEQERLAEQERKLAESNKAPSVAEAKAIAKQAEKVEEARATVAESVAAPVPVVEQQAKTTTFEDGTQVTARAKKGWVFTVGIPKGTVLDRTDPRVSGIPNRFFVLDERRINAAVKSGEVIPGITIVDESVTAVRSAR
jgi:phosphohistidine swiveling domain-containing protein